jgi:hypothetical protein
MIGREARCRDQFGRYTAIRAGSRRSRKSTIAAQKRWLETARAGGCNAAP